MPAIQFPTSSNPGQRPPEGAGRLLNVYAMKEADKAIWKQCPGLVSFATSSRTNFRGAQQIGNVVFAAWTDKSTTVSSAGVETVLSGTLAGSKPVTWAQNNKSPTPDIVAVDRDNGAYTVTSSSVTAFADPDLPTPNSVAFLDGYFLFTIGDGRLFATGVNDVTVDALAFAKCEAKPDGLTRGFVSGQLFYGMGPDSTEIWQNVGTSPFPLGRVQIVPVGIRGPFCIAGDQIGWGGQPIFVASDGTVRMWNGYQTQVISTPPVVRAILATANVEDLKASVYVIGDLAIWSLSTPLWTWEYNLATGQWHERVSLGQTTWRGRGAFKAFNKWLCGDAFNASLWELSATTYREGQTDVQRLIESAQAKQFPVRFPVHRADFDFLVGQGIETGISPIQTAPTVRISWTDDGGFTWSNPVIRSLGRQGEYRTLVSVAGCGMATQQGRGWRLEYSDPVYCSLLGGTFNEKLRV